MPQAWTGRSGGAPGTASGAARGSLRIRVTARTPPTAHRAAASVRAIRNPSEKAAGSPASAPLIPATAGSTATATSPAARATALLTPDATPACRSDAAASTVLVNGATVVASPNPSSTAPGSTAVAHWDPASTRLSTSNPAPASSGPTVSCSRGPIRVASAPERADSDSIRMVTGNSASPASNGEYPSTVWSWSTSRNVVDPSAAYTANVTTLAAVNWCEENRSSGSMGWPLRASTTRKPTRQATPPTAAPDTVALPMPSPPAGPSMSAHVTPARPSADSTAPVTSSPGAAVGSRLSGTWRTATRTTATATGMLMRNTARHDTASTNHPPRNGPRAAATPPRPDHAPMARDRSAGTNDAWSRARLPGVSSAPPTPWRARAAMRTSIDGARPQRADATANHTTPTTNTSRRP